MILIPLILIFRATPNLEESFTTILYPGLPLTDETKIEE